jgi:hypothetical protein
MGDFIATIEGYPDTLTAVVEEDREGFEASVEEHPDTLTAVVEDC